MKTMSVVSVGRMSSMRVIHEAPFALRVVQRKEGKAGIVYRRKADDKGRDRLQRIASLSPLVFTAATSLLREAVKQSTFGHTKPQRRRDLVMGAFHPLDEGWGARVACFALMAAGLRDGERLLRAVNHLCHADSDEAAWWLGLLTHDDNTRALRALRILTEAVQ